MAALLVVILPLASCGIPQEEYDNTLNNLTVAQEEYSSLNDTYAALSTNLEILTANLTDLTDKIDSLSGELETAEEDHANLVASFNATRSSYFEKQEFLDDARSKTEALERRLPTLEYEVYESDDTAFTINYPSEWKAVLDIQNMVVLSGSSGSTALCMILYGPSDEMTSQEMYEVMIDGFETSGFDYSFITEYPTMVSGQEAVSGLLIADETGIENTFYQIVSVGNEYTSCMVIFACLWSDYPQWSHTFGEMFDSFYLNPDYVYSFSWR